MGEKFGTVATLKSNECVIDYVRIQQRFVWLPRMNCDELVRRDDSTANESNVAIHICRIFGSVLVLVCICVQSAHNNYEHIGPEERAANLQEYFASSAHQDGVFETGHILPASVSSSVDRPPPEKVTRSAHQFVLHTLTHTHTSSVSCAHPTNKFCRSVSVLRQRRRDKRLCAVCCV